MTTTHELKEGALTFTPVHGEGSEPSLLIMFTSNNTGARYEQLLSCDKIRNLSTIREDGVSRHMFSGDPELLLDIVVNQACIKAVEEHGEYVCIVCSAKLGGAARMRMYEFVMRIERSNENGGESAEFNDINDLRRHNQVLAKRISKLESVIRMLAIEMFKKEHTHKSRDGEISFAGIQLLAAAGADLSQFGFEWLCEIARAAVRTGNTEICPSIIGAAQKFGANALSKGSLNRETLLYAVVSEAHRTGKWFNSFSTILALVDGLISHGADPRIACGKCSAMSLVDDVVERVGRSARAGPNFEDICKIQALMYKAS